MFVQRDNSSKVIGVFRQAQPGVAEEELPEDHPEVLAYLNPMGTPLRAIQNIEVGNPFTHRALREFFIGFGDINPAFKATLMYQRAKAADDLIRAERAKL
jgi:hypothetical protein